MSTSEIVWVTYGALLGAFALFAAGTVIHYWLRCWLDRRASPRAQAEFDRWAAEQAALRALTVEDQAWLTAQGWKP